MTPKAEAKAEARLLLQRLEREGHTGAERQCPWCMQPRPCRWQTVATVVKALL